jgi:hypothetical protein
VKKYVVGKDGEVIPVAPVAGERLPPFLQPMKLTVKNVPSPEEEAAAAAAAAAAAKGSKDKSKGTKRVKGVRVAGAREIEVQFAILSCLLCRHSFILYSLVFVLHPFDIAYQLTFNYGAKYGPRNGFTLWRRAY